MSNRLTLPPPQTSQRHRPEDNCKPSPFGETPPHTPHPITLLARMLAIISIHLWDHQFGSLEPTPVGPYDTSPFSPTHHDPCLATTALHRESNTLTTVKQWLLIASYAITCDRHSVPYPMQTHNQPSSSRRRNPHLTNIVLHAARHALAPAKHWLLIAPLNMQSCPTPPQHVQLHK